MQSIVISGYESGVQKNKKPFLYNDDAFATLYNAYTYRNEVKKREGLQLIGRFRRVLTSEVLTSTTPAADTMTIANIFTDLSISGESNASIEHGSLVITIGAPDNSTFTDNGDGSFAVTGLGLAAGSYVNYATGEVVLNFTGSLTGGASITVDINYFPSLPAMGILVRDRAGINDEQTMWFDTKYCYIHDGADFQEFLPAENATWNGTDSDFFWGTNYRGSDAQTRLFFVTNFVNDSGSPMRYTDASTWEEFQPAVSGTNQSEILTAALASGSAVSGALFLTNFPIFEGSVVITVSHNAGGENDVIFRDTPRDGTLVSTGSNTGTINYSTGEINLSFDPVLPGAGNWTVTAVYQTEATFIFTARILIPYYGRLLALNTYEGTTNGTAVNIFNRARFSQIGDPTQQDAWRSDVFGKGGFLDAPTGESIIGATFYKNTLIVTFERSTWRLQYLGEYGIPFIWERISSDFGSESTFSSILFDHGVLSVGDKAIVASSGMDVQRIDLVIPDTVYEFRNAEEGTKRVYGARDFRKELVYWCYPNVANFNVSTQYFPNETLVYNYRNNTFAFFRNSITCLGNFQYPSDLTWDRLDIFWDDFNVSWNSGLQTNYPVIACGNQQGFAHFYGYPDIESQADSTINAIDQESLYVSDVSVTTHVELTIYNHNLQNLECIYLTGLIYLDTSDSTPGSTTLNDTIYFVNVIDKDTVKISFFNPITKELEQNFEVTNVGDYIGGGLVALFPVLDIQTKDFNPVKQAGMNIKTSYIDFLFDTNAAARVMVNILMNTSNNVVGNLPIGNSTVESSNSQFGQILDISLDNPCVITSPNHTLLNGDVILFNSIVGTTELNGNDYTVTFIDVDTFSIDEDSSFFTAYERDGYWQKLSPTYFRLQARYGWHRFFATCFGQYISVQLTYDMEIMSQIQTHRQSFVLNAMQIYYRPGGKNIFGK